MPVQFAQARELGQTDPLELAVDAFGTPVGAIFLTVKFPDGGDEDPSTPNAIMSIGATDGTNVRSVGTIVANGEASREAYAVGKDSLVLVTQDSSGAIEGGVSFTSWIDGGVEVDFADPWDEENYITALLIGGPDTLCAVGSFDTTAGSQSISAGFNPNLVFFVTADCDIDGTPVNNAYMGFGYAAEDSAGTIHQQSLNWGHLYRSSGGTATQSYATLSTEYGLRRVDASGFAGGVNLVNFTYDGGFTIGQVGGAGQKGFYVAIRSQTPGYDLMSEILSLTDQAQQEVTPDEERVELTTGGWNPGLAVFLGGALENVDTFELNDEASIFQIGFATNHPKDDIDIDSSSFLIGARDAITTNSESWRTESGTLIARSTNGTGTLANAILAKPSMLGFGRFQLHMMYTPTTDRRFGLLLVENADKWANIGELGFPITINESGPVLQNGFRGELTFYVVVDGVVVPREFHTHHLYVEISGANFDVTHFQSDVVIATDTASPISCGPFPVHVSPDGLRFVIVDDVNEIKIGDLTYS